MLKVDTPENCESVVETQKKEFEDLLLYIDKLATHKLGYPVSLLTYLGIIDNSVLGIQAGSLANILINNVGDPFKDSETSLMEVKVHERAIISMLEKYYGVDKDQARGYVTTGGTEGNFAALWWSKRYLINKAIDSLTSTDNLIKQQIKEEQELIQSLNKIPMNSYQARAEHLQKVMDLRNSINDNKSIVQQLITPTVFYSRNHTHYSVPKISEIQRFNIKPVTANPNGTMNLDEFRKELIFHLASHPHCPIIAIANIGTTITGAIDDVPGIKKILEEIKPKPNYTIHMDGALTGFVMPIIKPFGDVKNYLSAIGANTLVFSAHKYPGLSQPCGIILATREFYEKAFEKTERGIDYVGNILDVTITGSRSGLNVLMFYNALRTFGMDKGNTILENMVKENIENGNYLRKKLIEIFGEDKVQFPYHFNILFPRPSAELAKKYQLMLTGETATICVLTNVTKDLIDKFIVDLKAEISAKNSTKEIAMTKTTNPKITPINTVSKSGYQIMRMGREHMQSTVDLFIKTFCDDEPITKHLGISYAEYEPFAMAVVQKAVKDGLSVVAVEPGTNKVVACAIGEDIADVFQPDMKLYPKMEPIFALIDQLSMPFFSNRQFKKGKVAHTWIAMVDKSCRGKGVSTDIDLACTNLIAGKGYDFTYAEFTNDISEKITSHYVVSKKINEILYDQFSHKGNYPFKGVKGGSAAYVLGIKPGVKIDSLQDCYIMDKTTQG